MRLWQHPSWVDNKSYQCKPIRRQQDNPCDNRASTEASSARRQCCRFTDSCHGWRDRAFANTCREAVGQQWGSPMMAATVCPVDWAGSMESGQHAHS